MLYFSMSDYACLNFAPLCLTMFGCNFARLCYAKLGST